MPFASCVQEVEHETGEEAVLGIFDEAADLCRRAGEERGEAGGFDADVFFILAASYRMENRQTILKKETKRGRPRTNPVNE